MACNGDIGTVVLKNETNSAETYRIVEAFCEVLGEHIAVEIGLKGHTMAENMLYGAFKSNSLSCYLAIMYVVNPTSTDLVPVVIECLTSV